MHTGCYHTWTDEHNGPAVSISSSDLRPEQWPSDCTHDWRPAQIRLPDITLVLLSFAAIDPPSTRGLASTVFLRSPSPWHATTWGGHSPPVRVLFPPGSRSMPAATAPSRRASARVLIWGQTDRGEQPRHHRGQTTRSVCQMPRVVRSLGSP
jgi:hypothetical protein